jgi:hypothetical protein
MAKPKPPIDCRRELVRGVRTLAHRHSMKQVFTDLMEVSAIAISNAVDRRQFEDREARYMEVVRRYGAEEFRKLAALFPYIVEAMDREGEPTDLLGQIFHDLELHNAWHGQFFSPGPLAEMMARMTVEPDHMKDAISRKGFVTFFEPAGGVGVFPLAVARVMRDNGLNPQQQLHVQAVDIDLKCVHMMYIQLSLWHIPAIIYHGDTLRMDIWSQWFTPAHMMGLWDARLHFARYPRWHDLSVIERMEMLAKHGQPDHLAYSETRPAALEHITLER